MVPSTPILLNSDFNSSSGTQWDQLSLYPLFNICTGTDIYRNYSPGVPPCPNGFGLVQGSMNGRGNGRGSIRNYFPGYPGYYVKSTDPVNNPQKLPLASEETCANYCKENIECCSFQYGLKRFGFWLCLMLTFSSPASAFWITNASRHQ